LCSVFLGIETKKRDKPNERVCIQDTEEFVPKDSKDTVDKLNVYSNE
jgi:hypothetical protein